MKSENKNSREMGISLDEFLGSMWILFDLCETDKEKDAYSKLKKHIAYHENQHGYYKKALTAAEQEIEELVDKLNLKCEEVDYNKFLSNKKDEQIEELKRENERLNNNLKEVVEKLLDSAPGYIFKDIVKKYADSEKKVKDLQSTIDRMKSEHASYIEHLQSEIVVSKQIKQ
jgi:hypothetical protein